MQELAYAGMFCFYVLLGVFAIYLIRVARKQSRLLDKQLKEFEDKFNGKN